MRTFMGIMILVFVVTLVGGLVLFPLLNRDHPDQMTKNGLTITRTQFHGHVIVCVEGQGFSPDVECWMDGEPGTSRGGGR